MWLVRDWNVCLTWVVWVTSLRSNVCSNWTNHLTVSRKQVCYGHSWIILKPLFSRALKIFISKAQRPSFWFCLWTKDLFQMIFLKSSFQFISTRVTSDLSSLNGFPNLFLLKLGSPNESPSFWCDLAKPFQRLSNSLVYLKIKWNDPYLHYISKHGSFTPFLENYLYFQSISNSLISLF